MRILELARTKPPARWRSRPSQLMASMSSSTVSREFCGRRGGRERRGAGILRGTQGQTSDPQGQSGGQSSDPQGQSGDPQGQSGAISRPPAAARDETHLGARDQGPSGAISRPPAAARDETHLGARDASRAGSRALALGARGALQSRYRRRDARPSWTSSH